jgi:hypothetical protein
MSEQNQTDVPSCIPPKNFQRNEHGLICDNTVKYVYRPDGTVDWRKMIKPEFLVPHKEVFETRGRPVPESTEGLEDKELLILLNGIKDLAATRGFTSMNLVLSHGRDRVSATCTITWTPNFETYGLPVSYSGSADATSENTSILGAKYMTTIAENRAFVRAVRNFLKVPILGSDEIGGPTSYVETDTAATSLLKETMKKYNVPWEALKKKLVEEKIEGAEGFTDPDEVPKRTQFELIERIKRRAAENAAKANSGAQ